jgi:hypothetical protein
MGDGGWEVSFDGSVNAFLVLTDTDEVEGGLGSSISERAAGLGAPLTTDDSARVRTGLLPTVFGINVKAPTTKGLDVAARIGLYPNISNNGKNTFHNTADLDMREIFATVDGAWGQILAGKTLSQFMGKNILTDMTLFGVGGVGAVTQLGGTTLGRIGFGYPYPQFNGRIQYTTPDMSGFKASVGVYDPAQISGNSVDPSGTGTGTFIATETDTPRMEGEASYAGNFGGADVSLWINGLWQEAEYTGSSFELEGFSNNTEVTAWGFGGGLQVTIPVGNGSLQLVGSGYTGEALGLTFMLDGLPAGAFADATDGVGEEREHDGFIGQAVYAFGQGTSLGYSYGETNADETPLDTDERITEDDVELKEQSLHVVMLWHDVTPNWRLIAEYGRQEAEWHDGADQDADIFSAGMFFFW